VTPEDRDDVPAEESLDDPATESRPSHVTTSPERQRRHKAKKHQLPIWQETILLLGIALVLAIVIKAFFVQAFYIPSQSMEPGLVENDRILVQKVSYWGDDEPERGDVIVFEDPDHWLSAGDTRGPTSLLARGLAKVGLYPTGGHLVKRVIGVAGDTIECCDEEGRLSVNGYPLDETDYVMQDGSRCAAPGSAQGECELQVGPIPDGYVFVMGDNRSNSQDSSARICADPDAQQCAPTRGLVPVRLVVGKVFALVWPQDRWDRITRPEVFEDVPDAE
jgi:signal peptidase I